jgi:hypothetical protein
LALFWFLAGILSTLAALILLLPWLRTIPRLGPLPSRPWQVGIGAGLLACAVLGLYHGFARPDLAARPTAPAAASSAGASSAFATAARVSGDLTSPATNAATSPAPNSSAGSMDSAIASLQARLAKGGGTAADWELLAKSYEFLGRPGDASKARARQLPPVPTGADKTASIPAVGSGTAVSGEVSLAAGLSTRAAAGATLFIVAKSVDSPGIPVAVFRAAVGTWPVRFTLDDSQAMLPGSNLSSAGRVTIEARISQHGQPLPASGDLQGSTGAINPADHQPLKILIDRVIT